jgi:hypothetical protein
VVAVAFTVARVVATTPGGKVENVGGTRAGVVGGGGRDVTVTFDGAGFALIDDDGAKVSVGAREVAESEPHAPATISATTASVVATW